MSTHSKETTQTYAENTASEIELRVRASEPASEDTQLETGASQIAPDNAVSLPPMDGGFDAWAYLGSAFLLEMVIWSYPSTYGVYLQYYSTHAFPGQTSMLANVGSIANGLLHMSSVAVLLIGNRYPWYKRHTMGAGLAIAVAGLVGAANSTKPWHLVLTQGVLFGIGGSVGGVIMPLAVETGLNRYGPKATLIFMALLLVVIAVPCSRYLKPRLPVARSVAPASFDTQFARTSSFWILFVFNALQGLASLIPSLYIPTFTSDLNLGTKAGVVVLSIMYGASAPGYIVMGWLSDRFDVRYSILLCSIGSGLAVLLLWGLAKSISVLIVFSCFYGFFSSSWYALWPRFTAITADNASQASSIWSIFVAGKGLGNFFSAPIATALLHPWQLTNKPGSAYGLKGYGPLILFTGLSLLATSSASLYRGARIPFLRRLVEILS
ncbi:hypothetical protein V5O48_012405 [Marasmius crinis-equi]|uniref:Major facilitator superfamily (MFS) profile domain-containing protein n=1 Tax=Marasmius crinis-equi TaxID=585013 RepID=A0ABR3F369_9AGAR